MVASYHFVVSEGNFDDTEFTCYNGIHVTEEVADHYHDMAESYIKTLGYPMFNYVGPVKSGKCSTTDKEIPNIRRFA